MSDDWDTGDSDADDITLKPRAVSPATLRRIYKTPDVTPSQQDDNGYRPAFVCAIESPDASTVEIVPATGPAPAANYVLTKETSSDDSLAFWELTVFVNSQAQCTWGLTDETPKGEATRVFRAYSYTWVDDTRIFGRQLYVDPFTETKEYGWGPEFYGHRLFGREWKQKPQLTF